MKHVRGESFQACPGMQNAKSDIDLYYKSGVYIHNTGTLMVLDDLFNNLRFQEINAIGLYVMRVF